MNTAPVPGPGSVDPRVSVLTPTGELDAATAPLLREQGCALIEDGHTEVVVDLSGITSCDADGLSALIGLRRCALEARGCLTLAAVPDDLARLLERTGMGVFLTAHPSLDEALAAVAAKRPTGTLVGS